MPLPDFASLLMQFEQMDMQKEQLLLQRKQQTAQQIAQAVSTLVSTPMEGRQGYLGMLQQELGLDTGFLQSLAMSAPTPTSILLNQGLQRAIESGATDPNDIAAYALGANPMAYRMNAQIGKYLEDGTVPAYIRALPPEAQGAALTQMMTNAAGLPNLFEIKNQETIGQVKNDLRPGATTVFNNQQQNQRQTQQLGVQQREGAANRGIDMMRIKEGARQADQDLNFKSNALLYGEAGDNWRAGLAAQGRAGRGSGVGSGTTAGTPDDPMGFAAMSDMDFMKAYGEVNADATKAFAIKGGVLGSGYGTDAELVMTNKTRVAAVQEVWAKEMDRRAARLKAAGFGAQMQELRQRTIQATQGAPSSTPGGFAPSGNLNFYGQQPAGSFLQNLPRP